MVMILEILIARHLIKDFFLLQYLCCRGAMGKENHFQGGVSVEGNGSVGFATVPLCWVKCPVKGRKSTQLELNP